MQSELFSAVGAPEAPGTPLAEKSRPHSLAEVVGQEKVKKLLRKYIETQNMPNLILWGPPGTGKTTIARILASQMKFEFHSLNAVSAGVKELRSIGEQAKLYRFSNHTRTLLFVDEIHRFNKSQQDILLPFLETGDLVLIGATTENPSYELNRALLSRCQVLKFERLVDSEIKKIIEQSLLRFSLELSELVQESAQSSLFLMADGDARRVINLIEEIIAWKNGGFDLQFPLDESSLKEHLQKTQLSYDKTSDHHYDMASALIKSIRGSEVDSALYYLARMIKGGEDPNFITRRLMILASEDIGNADPRALQMAVSAAQALEFIGWPEGAIILGQLVCYLSSAPKSNRSYLALKKAQEFVESTGSLDVPLALRSAQTPEMKKQGYGESYQYPHESQTGWIDQNYFPTELKTKPKFYEPKEIGFEKNIIEFLKWLKR